VKTTYGEARSLSFGTLAETLERSAPLKQCRLLEAVSFSASDWKKDPPGIHRTIRDRFGTRLLVIKVSDESEDVSTPTAGLLSARRAVNGGDSAALKLAIEEVLDAVSGSSRVLVRVRPKLKDVALSGVIKTYDVKGGGPYYILNYDDESGTVDEVTGGHGANKTVVIRRDFQPEFVEGGALAELLTITQELEHFCHADQALDIEFATTMQGEHYLLGVQRVSLRKNFNVGGKTRIAEALANVEDLVRERSLPRPGVAGASNVFGQMLEPNPAELIGTNPTPLALSLYQSLISDSVWREARRSMGYSDPYGEILMVSLAGRPYIDGRNALNSLLPFGMDEPAMELVVDAWLARLVERPELHDRVLYEVAQSVVDFSFDQDFRERYGGVLNVPQLRDYRERLRYLTEQNISLADNASMPCALAVIQELHESQAGAESPLQTASKSGTSLLWTVQQLLVESRSHGSYPFSVVARHAFAAEAFLRSCVQRGALEPQRINDLKDSLSTASSRMARAFEEVLDSTLDEKSFLEQYGHVRDAMFDIRSLRYDQRTDFFVGSTLKQHSFETPEFFLSMQEERDIAALLEESRLEGITPESLLQYTAVAIAGREECKLVFMRHLSDMLELLAHWGDFMGLEREDLSYLTVQDILGTLHATPTLSTVEYLRDLVERRVRAHEISRALYLSPVIRDQRDLHVVSLHRGAPYFVTSIVAEGPTICPNDSTPAQVDLAKKIVCLEHADIGFDWLVNRPIRGIVTKFGGADSPLALRCAERDLPAAIGVGEQPFDRILRSGRVQLNCRDEILLPM